MPASGARQSLPEQVAASAGAYTRSFRIIDADERRAVSDADGLSGPTTDAGASTGIGHQRDAGPNTEAAVVAAVLQHDAVARARIVEGTSEPVAARRVEHLVAVDPVRRLETTAGSQASAGDQE